MLKAIIEVYFELLVTNFYAQISCSCHSKFVKIISILMHRIAITVFVYIRQPEFLVSYMSHKLRIKIMVQLNFVQRLQIANLKGYSNLDNSARHDFFIKTTSDVFAHALYKCPVNSCFEWASQMLLSFKGHQVMYIIFLVPCTEVTYEKVFSYTVIK